MTVIDNQLVLIINPPRRRWFDEELQDKHETTEPAVGSSLVDSIINQLKMTIISITEEPINMRCIRELYERGIVVEDAECTEQIEAWRIVTMHRNMLAATPDINI